jgi:hypothetical protein
MDKRKRTRLGTPAAGEDCGGSRSRGVVHTAASKPAADAGSQWGGKRAGAGRPTKAKQRERAQEAAKAIISRLGESPNLKESMRRLHNAYESLLTAELAKGPGASKKFIIECGQGMRGTVDLITRIEQTEAVTPVAPAVVIRAPAVEPDAETWKRKYAPRDGAEGPAAISDGSEREPIGNRPSVDTPDNGPPNNSEPPECQRTLQPGPHLTGLGPHEFGPLSPEQLTDLPRRRRAQRTD